MPKKSHKQFINREISWLAFNERVLQEAQDKSVPLIERMRFLGIFSNNLDEFFKVRVATLRRAAKFGRGSLDPMDFDPAETLAQIHQRVVKQQLVFEKTFKALSQELARHDIHFVDETKLDAEQKTFVENYFEQNVRPYLVPLMLSSKVPFPDLKDNVIYLAIALGHKNEKSVSNHALIELSQILPRFIELPKRGNQHKVMFLDDVIRYRLRKVFGIFAFDQVHAYTIKITRDAELDVDDDLSKGLVEKMSRSLSQRKRGRYVRLNYDKDMPPSLLSFILQKTRIRDTENIIPGGRYHNKKDLMRFPDFGRKDLRYEPMEPLSHPDLKNKPVVMDAIAKRDVLLHYPYHSFTHIIDLLREAAIDPRVRTIRISIYRVAKNSQIVNALVNAAKNGKRVIAVVELQARFDEEDNIHWTQQLQEAGARVIPGVPGLKVHSKLILISRKEGTRTVRYSHIGSGNFHEKTARVYSDVSLLTANRDIGREVRKIFEFFESNYQRNVFRHLIVSPFSTRRKFTDLIHEEIKNAKKNRPAWITIKLNNLVDAGMIRKLYEASQAGVKVNLIIRGTCSLVPGEKGLSENIRVVSVVGRFLEHARIISFCNNGKPLFYISSGDWMLRNLDLRIEVTAPVNDERLKHELQDYLDMQLSPYAKVRVVDRDLKNAYLPVPKGKQPVDCQVAAYAYFKGK
ncbi:MAG: polyphosphate kinase 1 [Flavobacteriales bacterium]|nr:polyphosphate kinase 1 [Flavobacteriales bacterium]